MAKIYGLCGTLSRLPLNLRLDNHFHAILSAERLPQIMGTIKRHTAKRLLEQVRAEGGERLLNQRHFGERSSGLARGYHPEALASDEIMLQKLDYLHHNSWRAVG